MDTDTIVAAIRSPYGASAEIIVAARLGLVQLLASTALMIEYEAVCSRPEHLRNANLSRKQVQTFLDVIAALVEPVQMHFLWRPQLRDPDAEMVLETAINGQATAILTFNVRHFLDAPDRFGLMVLRPIDALRRMRS